MDEGLSPRQIWNAPATVNNNEEERIIPHIAQDRLVGKESTAAPVESDKKRCNSHCLPIIADPFFLAVK
jgi:hypothetical protein